MENLLQRINELETELLLLNEKLKISQSLVKIGFWELNCVTRQLFLSEESKTIINIESKSDWINLDEISQKIAAEDQPMFLIEMTKLITGEDHLDIEFSLLNENAGEKKSIKAIAKVTKEKKINNENLIGIFQDISEQKTTELSLKNAKNKAEEADILKSAFLANMSHEIRTPLNAILGFSRLLTNPDIPTMQKQEYSEYITNSANNLLNLIRDIVDVSKIEAGKMNIEKSPCLVNRILKELTITFEKEKARQFKNHIEIRAKEGIEKPEFAIFTDPYRFHQILINLIGNALKFTERGLIEFGYSINKENFLEFYVKDTGIGIPNDKIDFIFSRFGQIIDNKIKNPGGTGLGLSITKHLVERLGGKIWVESEVGTGTIFSFTLPLEIVEKSDDKISKLNSEFDASEIGHIKILAVEDDKINMILLEDILKINIKNITIEKAENGIEAINKLKSNDFDLIIMDIRMPLLDGYAATKIIREEFPVPKNSIPILGLSAHALNTEIEEGKKLGMNDFLSKPIQPDELFSKIKKLVKNITSNIQDSSVHEKDFEKQANDSEQIVNLDFFKKLYKDSKAKINKTLGTYIIQVPEQISLLENSHKKNEGNMKNIAHSLKSTFKYLGRYDISELAREIEYCDEIEHKDLYISERIQKINKHWEIIEKKIREIIA